MTDKQDPLMTPDSELRRQLWEFAYELLSDEEAARLTDRISSDPAVARAYAEVKLQTNEVRSALLHDTARVPLHRPAAAASSPARRPSASSASPRTPRKAAGNLLSAALAATLLLALGYSFLHQQAVPGPLASRMSASPVRMTVLASPSLQPSVSSPFTLQTRDMANQPLATGVDVVVTDLHNEVRWRQEIHTDEQGRAEFTVPAAYYDPGNRLEFRASPMADEVPPLVAPLAPRRPQWATHLTTDRQQYYPGETVHFRSVTLPALATMPLPETVIQVELLDQDGESTELAPRTVHTDHARGVGQILLPEDMPLGDYRLVARSPENRFADFHCPLEIVPREAPQLDIQLAYSQPHFGPEDQLIADVQVLTPAGTPVADAELHVSADVDAQPLAPGTQQLVTSVDGAARLQWQLPSHLTTGRGQLNLRVGHEELEETFTFPLPIQIPEVVVRWAPEGGSLIGQVQNQVYFTATDRQGQPVSMAGRLVNEVGEAITEVQTGLPGVGRFALTPNAHESFRLELQEPAGWEMSAEPLKASSRDSILLRVASRVLPVDGVLDVEFVSPQSGRSLFLGVFCGDVEVGRASLQTRGDQGPQRIRVPLDPHAEGILRVAVYDVSREASPPQLVCQRQIFRRPRPLGTFAIAELPPPTDAARQLRLVIQPDADQPATEMPRENHASPEFDQNPSPMVLGVSVVDSDPSGRWSEERSRPSHFFHLWSRLPQPVPRDVTRLAHRHLSRELHEIETETLDLVLGVWERFLPGPGIPPSDTDQQALYALAPSYRLGLEIGLPVQPLTESVREAGGLQVFSAPRVIDNAGILRDWQRALEAEMSEARRALRRTMGRWLVGLASVALVILGTAALLRASRAAYWVPSLAVATLCLLMGSVWLGLRFSNPLAPQGVGTDLARLDDRADSRSSGAPQPMGRVGQPAELAFSAATSESVAETIDALEPQGPGSLSPLAAEGALGDLRASPDGLAGAALREERLTELAGGRAMQRDSTLPTQRAPVPATRSVAPAPGSASRMERSTPPSIDVAPPARALEERAQLAADAPEAARRPDAPTPHSIKITPLVPRFVSSEQANLKTGRELPRNRQTAGVLDHAGGAPPRNPPYVWESVRLLSATESEEDGLVASYTLIPGRATRQVEVLATAHGPWGMNDWRQVVPLSEQLSIHLSMPARLALGEAPRLPIQLVNHGAFPADVQLHGVVSSPLRWGRDDEHPETDESRGALSETEQAIPSSDDEDAEQVLVRSIRLDPGTASDLELPRLEAIEPGQGTVQLRIELPDRDLEHHWQLEVTPDLPRTISEQAGWLEEDDLVRIPWPPRESKPGPGTRSGYLHLRWRGYPSLAAELEEAVRSLTLQRVTSPLRRRELKLPPEGDARPEPVAHEADGAEAEPAWSSLIPAHAALNDWLNRTGVAAPQLRLWAAEWLQDTHPDGQEPGAEGDSSLRLDTLRGARQVHGGWSTPRETAAAIRALVADESRPVVAREDCFVQFRDVDGTVWAEARIPAMSTRALVWEGWAKIELGNLDAEPEHLEIHVVVTGAERIPYVWSASLYLEDR
jgi:hypothetical protein